MSTMSAAGARNPANDSVKDRKRLPWLDVFRGVAVLLVLCHHLGLPKLENASLFYRGVLAAQFAGWIGVDLFFVLSGFLVSGILFRQYAHTGTIYPVRFLIRRGFKIYPAFWFMIGVTLALVWNRQNGLAVGRVLAELLFLQNYLSGIWVHTWSLAVEEHSYIGLCLLLTILVRNKSNCDNPFALLPLIVCVISIVVLILRLATSWLISGQSFSQHISPTHLRCDTFFIGVLLAYYYQFFQRPFLNVCCRWRWLFLFVGVGCFVPVLFWNLHVDRVVWTWLFSSNAIGGALLLMWALGLSKPPGRVLRLIGVIGNYSYSIYLWHILVGMSLLELVSGRQPTPNALLTFSVLYFAISIGWGILMAYIVEWPALYLRDRCCNEVGTLRMTQTPECDVDQSNRLAVDLM